MESVQQCLWWLLKPKCPSLPDGFLKVHDDHCDNWQGVRKNTFLLPPQMKWISFSTWLHFIQGGWLTQFITLFLSQAVAVQPQLHSLALTHFSLERPAKCYHVWQGQMRAGEKKGGGSGSVGGGQKRSFNHIGPPPASTPFHTHTLQGRRYPWLKPAVSTCLSVHSQNITDQFYKQIHICVFWHFMVKVWLGSD